MEDQLQKHETLVAEINANKKRLDDLESRGQELVNEDHYAAPEIAGEKIVSDISYFRFYNIRKLPEFPSPFGVVKSGFHV